MTLAIDRKTGKVCGQTLRPREDQPAGTIRILTCGKGLYIAHPVDVDAASVRLKRMED